MASQVLVHYDFGGVGPPLLLLHANGFHGRAYSPMAQTLSRYYRCIALDFPGQGSCPLGNTPITAPAFADCLQLTLQRLGVQGD